MIRRLLTEIGILRQRIPERPVEFVSDGDGLLNVDEFERVANALSQIHARGRLRPFAFLIRNDHGEPAQSLGFRVITRWSLSAEEARQPLLFVITDVDRNGIIQGPPDVFEVLQETHIDFAFDNFLRPLVEKGEFAKAVIETALYLEGASRE